MSDTLPDRILATLGLLGHLVNEDLETWPDDSDADDWDEAEDGPLEMIVGVVDVRGSSGRPAMYEPVATVYGRKIAEFLVAAPGLLAEARAEIARLNERP